MSDSCDHTEKGSYLATTVLTEMGLHVGERSVILDPLECVARISMHVMVPIRSSTIRE